MARKNQFLTVTRRLFSLILRLSSVILNSFQDLLRRKFLFLKLIIKNLLKIRSIRNSLSFLVSSLHSLVSSLTPSLKTPQFRQASTYLILLALFLTTIWPRSSFHQTAWELGKWPKNSRFHLQLAQEAAKIHDFNLVQKELSLANFSNPTLVHQQSSIIDQILNEKIAKNQIIKAISSWEEIIKIYPHYRDAYLKLSLLYWQINNQLKADTYLQKAYQLSPNYPLIAEIKQLFK